jgi:hypothetical protein
MADHLFRLIRSLSKNEKIYIKRNAALHTSKGEKNQYIKLFDTIDGMKVYEEKILRKHFAKDAFLNSLSTGKNYLFNFILRQLESYHKGIRTEVRSCLNQAEILFELGLIDQCRKKIEKAESLADKYNLTEEKYIIWNWKLSLPESGTKSEKQFAALEKMHVKMIGDMKTQLEMVEDDYELKLIQNQCRLLGKTGDKGILELENILAGLEKKKAEKTWSFSAAFSHYQKLTTICMALNKSMKELVFRKKKIELLNANLHMIDVQPYLYTLLAELERSFQLEFSLGYYDQLLESFESLHAQISTSPSHKKLLELFPLSLRFGACIRLGMLKSAEKIIPKIQHFFETIERSETSEVQKNKFVLDCALVHMAQGAYSDSLKCIDELLYGTAYEVNTDIYYFAHFLQLLIHFEKGNSDLLEYKTRAVYRSLLKQKAFSATERLLLAFFKKESALDWDRKTEKNVFVELKNKLVQLFRSHPEEKKILNYFDLMAWVDSKIEGKSIASVLEERYKKVYSSETGKQLFKYLS